MEPDIVAWRGREYWRRSHKGPRGGILRWYMAREGTESSPNPWGYWSSTLRKAHKYAGDRVIVGPL